MVAKRPEETLKTSQPMKREDFSRALSSATQPTRAKSHGSPIFKMADAFEAEMGREEVATKMNRWRH